MSLHSKVQKIDAQSKNCFAHAQKPNAYFKQNLIANFKK
jgi:hypothetical protein